MANSPFQSRGQIDGKESPLKFYCDSESLVSKKENAKLLANYMSRLSRYTRVATVVVQPLVLNVDYLVCDNIVLDRLVLNQSLSQIYELCTHF